MEAFLPVLRRVPLFAGLDQGSLVAALDCLGAKESTFAKDEVIFLAGSPARRVGVVCAGGALVVKEDFTGNRSILTALAPGDLFGEAFVCAGVRHLPVSVVAGADATVLLLNFGSVLRTGDSSCPLQQALIRNMMAVLASKNVVLSRKIDILSARSTKDKLIAYLSGVARATGSETFTIPLSRQQLADYLCVDRSAMTTALYGLRREGLLDFQGNRFTLPG